MAGRRAAQESPESGDTGGSRHLRPSERRAVAAGEPLPAPKRDSRKKTTSPAATPAGKRPQPSPEAMERAKALLNPPKAPWYPLPLAEAAIVIGMIAMLVSVALKNAVGASAAFTLIILGTAEFSWREHRHGYRSHASILGAIIALFVGIVAWRVLGVTRNVCIGIAAVTFLMALGMLDRTYVPARQRTAAPSADDTTTGE